MIIGIPKEIKDLEFRVGATPWYVRSLVDAGHHVIVESDAAERIGFSNEDYEAAGAQIMQSAAEVYRASEMIIKVKEPQAAEYPLMREGQILYCFLHLAPDPILTNAIVERGIVGIAYETITNKQGRLPLLEPMSEVAGRVSIQAGANSLHMGNGGRGVLLGGVPGVLPGQVVIIGGGTAGTEAARMAMGLGADVAVVDKNLARLRELNALFDGRIKTIAASAGAIEQEVQRADLVVGAVLVPGKTAPRLITREMVRTMKHGSVIVDISIDQGGCCETSRPTTHSVPTYVEEGVVHYCVTNMPAACARSATIALCNATMDHALNIAKKGYREALLDDPHLRLGLNVSYGKVTNAAVAQDLGYEFKPPESVL